MKFLCDRCKTRYSIGDERVRGKILKIRCKNCANVITVREGMSADAEASQPAAPEYAGRAKKPTTVAPTALGEASDPVKAIKDLVNDPIRGDRSRSAAPPGGEPPHGEPSPVRGDRPGAAGPGTRGAGAPAPAAKEPVAAAKDTARGFGAGKRGAPSDGAGRGQLGAGRRGGLDVQRGEPSNALNAAFASAMAKPPPALEEEWYVSIDGDQAGPFSLSEAQGWVAQKALDAELHCWSEGFDDWLPVDKVSHFRGLRKRPVTVAPPPLPRGVGPQRIASAPVPVDNDPKPLFAATMASLERGAPVASSQGLVPAPSARATPSLGIPSRLPPAGKDSNGSRVQARDAGRAPGAIGDAGRGDNGITSARGAPTTPLLARPADARRAGAPSSGSSGPSRPAGTGGPFDISEGGDAKTQIEALPFSDPIIEPVGAPPSRPSSQAPSSSDAALTSPHLPASSTLHGTGANPAMTTAAVTAAASDFGDDDELAIGEVSRVVKLADIVRAPRNPERPVAPRRAGTATGSGGRATGQNPALRSTGSVAALVPGTIPDGAPDAPAEIDPSLTMAPVRKSHRRGLIALLSVAGVMVLGVVGAVILLVTTNDDPTGGTLGQVRDIDTSRPEDPLTHRPIDPAGTLNPPPNPFVPRPPPRPPRPNLNPPVGSNRDPEPPPGSSLRSDEVEDVAHKYQDMTKRCYLRSQRGADAILIGDVKKIAVTLKIDKDGNVGDVQLSEHAADNLGKCLSGSIRGWKFRPSSGGTFRFSLNFVGS